MKEHYSEKEFLMIKELSPYWGKLIEDGLDRDVYPPTVLDILGMECFIHNKSGNAVESLRRCLKAIHNDNIYRKTPEYENLIEL